jgi:hypothetical protein
MTKLNFTLKGDTLTVSDINRSNGRDRFPSIELTSTDSLKSMIVKNSGITFENYNWKKMNFSLDKSYLWLNQKKKTISSLSSLNILAKNHSNINSDNFKIENLSINLQKSEASLELITNKINGSLADSSRVEIRHAGEISMRTDSTSTVNVNY